jgi:periplasmic protein TonB
VIRAGDWAIAAVVAIGLHGAVLGVAMSSNGVMMEASAGRPGAVWGLPVETIADIVDPASSSVAEPTEVDAETTETTDVQTAEAVEMASLTDTEPVSEAPTASIWEGGIAVAATEVEPAEPVDAAEEVEVAALTPAEASEAIAAEDITTPLPRLRPNEVPRVEAPPKPLATKLKTPAKPVAKAAAPAGEQVGSGGKRQGDGGRQLVSSYAGRVASHLQRYKRYPAGAGDQRLTGTATITFTIGADGRVRAARLARSSGAGVFDREVVAMVDRAAPFPPIPPAIGKTAMTFTVPVRFKPR